MYCPKCKNSALISPTHLLASGDPQPRTCPRCGGVWLTVKDQRDWEQLLDHIHDLKGPDKPERQVADGQTGLCPEGHTILTRAKVDLEPPFYLERCSKCGGVWFDQGELRRLFENHMVELLPSFWSFREQLQRERKRVHDSDQARLREKIGDDLYDRIGALAREMRDHPDQSEALAYFEAVLKNRTKSSN